MSRWSKAAARLNRAADGFYSELITILRPTGASGYVKGGDLMQVAQVAGVISEGEAQNPADGEAAGSRSFNLVLGAGGLEASFERTRFASRDEWPKARDVLRVESGPRLGELFEALRGGADDGDRVNVPLIRRSENGAG